MRLTGFSRPSVPQGKHLSSEGSWPQCEGSKAIFMSLCGGCALAWGNLESVLPFKLWARPPSSAAQLSCYLIFTKSCWKHSLPFLKEWGDILLCLKVSTWAKILEVCRNRWCCVCRCGAAAPKVLQSCTSPAPGSAWPQHLDWRGFCLGLQNLGECDAPLDHQDGLCEGQQNQKCLWEVHLSTAWVNEPWRDVSWKKVSSTSLCKNSAGTTSFRIRKQ